MLKPLSAYRPEGNKAHLVPSRSVDAYTPAQLYDKLENNPYSFLQIIRPETEILMTNEDRFERIRLRLDQFIAAGVFELDEEPSYFLYEQSVAGKTYTGIIGLLDVNKAKIHLHEKTLESRENLFAEYLKTTGFQAEPVLVFGRATQKQRHIVSQVKSGQPTFDFYTTNEIGHRLWTVSSGMCKELQEALLSQKEYFLADGHHRYGSTCKVAKSLGGNQAAQHILAMYMDEEDIGIDSFERWIDTSGLDIRLEAFENIFSISKKTDGFQSVDADLELFTQGQWYCLNFRGQLDKSLPPAYLMSEVLEPIFGIKDAKKDKRITYLHQEPFDQSSVMLAKGLSLGFRLPPVSVEVLKKTALEGGTMPPKSTYIEPKLRSGMLLHLFK